MENLQLENRAEAAEKRSDELARANKRLRTQSEKAEKVRIISKRHGKAGLSLTEKCRSSRANNALGK